MANGTVGGRQQGQLASHLVAGRGGGVGRGRERGGAADDRGHGAMRAVFRAFCDLDAQVSLVDGINGARRRDAPAGRKD